MRERQERELVVGGRVFRENWVEIRFSLKIFKDSRYWKVSVGLREEANGRGLKYPTDRIINGGKL